MFYTPYVTAYVGTSNDYHNMFLWRNKKIFIWYPLLSRPMFQSCQAVSQREEEIKDGIDKKKAPAPELLQVMQESSCQKPMMAQPTLQKFQQKGEQPNNPLSYKLNKSLWLCGVGRILNIGIKHGFSCINICQVPREVLKTEAGGRSFQHLPRDLANVNALKNHVW